MAKKEKHHERAQKREESFSGEYKTQEIVSPAAETKTECAVPVAMTAIGASSEKVSYFTRLKTLFFKPSKFLEYIEKESEYLPGLVFLAVLIAISQLISIIIALPSSNISGLAGFIFPSIINIALAFIIPFILGGIAHLGILIFGGKKGFFSTCKLVSYGVSLMMVYSIVFVIFMAFYNIAFPIDTSVLTALGEKMSHGNFTYGDLGFLGGRMVIMGIFALAALIHGLYFVTLGVAKFQDMKRWKAFVGIIFFPAILMIFFFYVMSYALSQIGNLQGAGSLQGNLAG
jgi:hypothetical protein